MMKSPRFFSIFLMAVGLAIGFVAGRSTPALKATVLSGECPAQSRSSHRSESSSRAREGMLKMHSLSNDSKNRDLQQFYASLTSSQLAREASKLEILRAGESTLDRLWLFGRWAEMDPLAALAQARALGAAGERECQVVLQSWANSDPLAAAHYFTDHAGSISTDPQAAASVIARSWAQHDPAAAFAWATSLGPGLKQALNAVIGEVAQREPRQAAQLLAGLDPAQRQEASAILAAHWGAADFSAAESWIHTLPAEQGNALMARAISGLSISNPQAAASHFALIPEGGDRDRCMVVLMNRWASEDPQAAAQWLQSQPGESTRKFGVTGLVNSLVTRDPEGALKLVNTLLKGTGIYDGAATAYIKATLAPVPDLLEIATTISNDADRGQSIAHLMTRWQKEDRTAAEHYLQQTFGIGIVDIP